MSITPTAPNFEKIQSIYKELEALKLAQEGASITDLANQYYRVGMDLNTYAEKLLESQKVLLIYSRCVGLFQAIGLQLKGKAQNIIDNSDPSQERNAKTCRAIITHIEDFL